jgi:exodeoxyribonuclease VII large subunit
MQGEGVEQSIITALDSINAMNESASVSHEPPFDCVVIIRGGGATSDLSGFDTLALAENVAQFPIPIITGIGHDRDESILDMVSHLRVKTPTAAAALLVSHLKEVADAIDEAQKRITYTCQNNIANLKAQLSNLADALPRLYVVVKTRHEARIDSLFSRILASIQQKIVGNQTRIDAMTQRIPMLTERKLTAERHQLQLLEEKTRSLDPTLLLKRGYSITLHQGKAVRDPLTLKTGDEIETCVEKGTIKSIITS